MENQTKLLEELSLRLEKRAEYLRECKQNSDDEIKQHDFVVVYPLDDRRIKYLVQILVTEDNHIYCSGDRKFSKEYYGWEKVIISTDNDTGLPLLPEEYINKYIEAYNNKNPMDKINVSFYQDFADLTTPEEELGVDRAYYGFAWYPVVNEGIAKVQSIQMNYSRKQVQELFDKYNRQIKKLGVLNSEQYLSLRDWTDKNI